MVADGGVRDVQPFPNDDSVSWETVPSFEAHEPPKYAAVHGTNAKRDPPATTTADARWWDGEHSGDDEITAEYGRDGRNARNATWHAEHALLSF